MGEARAKAAGEMGGPIRFGKKMGVSVGGAAPKGRAVPWGDWRKGASKEVEAMVEGERNGEGWSGVARGHCWEAREQGGVGVGLGCPKAAVTLKDEDTGGTACHPLLPLPSIFPSIRIFSSESALGIRGPEVLELLSNFV